MFLASPLPPFTRPLDKLSFNLTVKGSVHLAHTWLAVASPQVAIAAVQFNTDVVAYAFGGKCVGIDQSWVYEYSLQSKSTAYDQCRLEMKHHVQKCHFCLEISLLFNSREFLKRKCFCLFRKSQRNSKQRYFLSSYTIVAYLGTSCEFVIPTWSHLFNANLVQCTWHPIKSQKRATARLWHYNHKLDSTPTANLTAASALYWHIIYSTPGNHSPILDMEKPNS